MKVEMNAGQRIDTKANSAIVRQSNAVQNAAFSKVLSTKVESLKFSAHAKSRLTSRNILVTPQLMDKLNAAVAGAEKKGARDSLILLSDLAFIVNVPKRVVITAMEREGIRDNVFTNIDSTVIAG